MISRRVNRLPRGVPTRSRNREASPKRAPRWLRWVVPALILLWLVRSFLGAFDIKSIKAVGADGSPDLAAQKQAETLIKKNFMWGNWLFLTGKKLSDAMRGGDSAVKTVIVKRQWPNKVLITVSLRRPTLNWQTGERKYQLDSDGTIIGPANNDKLPTITDTSNLPVRAGDRVVPSRFVTFCQDILLQLKPQTGLNVASLRIPDTTSELYVQTDRNYFIKFDTTRPAGDELADLKLVLSQLGKLGKSPNEYIDLRVAGKAYYK